MSPEATNRTLWFSRTRGQFEGLAFLKVAPHVVKAVITGVFFGALAAATVSSSVEDIALKKADALADVYNWHAAAPYYAEAEKFFTARRDTQKGLLAHIGYIRATFEERSFSDTARYFSYILMGRSRQTIQRSNSSV